jgi:Fur family peroxide stress response transcriptional regulator
MKMKPDTRFQSIVNKLKQNHHKLTPQRLAIIRILSASTAHPSVDDIHDQLKRRFPGISLPTVYRNIMLIKSLGEVLELGFAEGGNRYDGRRPHPHPHLVCLKCHKIVDPEVESFSDISRAVSDKSGFEIQTYRLDFFGICPKCQERKDEPQASR